MSFGSSMRFSLILLVKTINVTKTYLILTIYALTGKKLYVLEKFIQNICFQKEKRNLSIYYEILKIKYFSEQPLYVILITIACALIKYVHAVA